MKLSFLVPNEEPTARVTEVQIAFPTPPETPIPTVTVGQKPGWTVKVTTLKLTGVGAAMLDGKPLELGADGVAKPTLATGEHTLSVQLDHGPRSVGIPRPYPEPGCDDKRWQLTGPHAEGLADHVRLDPGFGQEVADEVGVGQVPGSVDLDRAFGSHYSLPS